jgi:hypothetical protein
MTSAVLQTNRSTGDRSRWAVEQGRAAVTALVHPFGQTGAGTVGTMPTGSASYLSARMIFFSGARMLIGQQAEGLRGSSRYLKSMFVMRKKHKVKQKPKQPSQKGVIPPRYKWDTGSYQRDQEIRFILPWQFLYLCKLTEVTPHEVLDRFMNDLGQESWKRRENAGVRQALVEYFTLCGYGQSGTRSRRSGRCSGSWMRWGRSGRRTPK